MTSRPRETSLFNRPPFKPDAQLPVFARTGKDFAFNSTKLEKGHMARHEDLEAFGLEACKDGALMSNIVPQRQGRNHKVWGVLENEHHNIVADPESSGIGIIWVISGPYFEDGDDDNTISEDEVTRIGEDRVAKPDGTYKVIGWHDENGGFHARAYMIRQDDTDTDLSNYLFSIDDVEAKTGLNFFPLLDDAVENVLEAHRPSTLW